MTKGIVIIATKHPYYGRMAYNLAVSIKAHSPVTPVVVLHSGRGLAHLTDAQKLMFDDIIEMPGADELGCGNKLYAIDYTPFDSTLLIDADNAWMPGRDADELFRELEGVPFTAITEGKVDFDKPENDLRPDYFMWANVDEIKKAYNLQGTMYQFRSEMMYFERTEEVVTMFARAREIYGSPEVPVTMFGGNVPDEFALNIAACIYGIHPHKYKWKPCYWDRIHKRPFPYKDSNLYRDYWVLSTGGNAVTYNTVKLYNRIVKAACYKLGVQFLFTLQPKRSAIVERQTI